MKIASLAAPAAALLAFAWGAAAIAADEARPTEERTAEERLLGSDDEAARFAALQPFTRQIGVSGEVAGSLDAALTADLPAVAQLEAMQLLRVAIDSGRDVHPGDRFYVRYEHGFTAEGIPTGVGRVLWVELVTKAKGTVSIHRFRPVGGSERFWLASGEAATPPAMRLPLDAVTVSSGFGLRPDPLDKPDGMVAAMGPLPDPPPVVATAAPAPATVSAPEPEKPAQPPAHEEKSKPATRHTVHGSLFTGQFGGMGPRASLDVNRLEFETAEARRAAPAHPAEAPPAAPEHTEQAAAAAPPPPRVRQLFMHDGIDLVAPIGTPIYAAGDGVVVGAAPHGRYGNWIRIEHQAKVATVYGHLSEFASGIEEGMFVNRGDLIGFVGNTGRSTGAHLHFEILANGKAVDPMGFADLKPAQLRGADLDRFRKQVKAARAERDSEIAAMLACTAPM
jgi:hypothetical protein